MLGEMSRCVIAMTLGAVLCVAVISMGSEQPTALMREASAAAPEGAFVEETPDGKSSLVGPGKDESAAQALNVPKGDDATVVGQMNPFWAKKAKWEKVEKELAKSVEALSRMPAGVSKDKFKAELDGAQKDCAKYKMNNYGVCKKLYCSYQAYCADHEVPLAKHDKSCEKVHEDSTQKIPANVDAKCKDKPRSPANALTGATPYSTCQCHSAKFWAYDRCEYLVKHVDRACLARYRGLETFVSREKAHKAAVIKKEVDDKAAKENSEKDASKRLKERTDKVSAKELKVKAGAAEAKKKKEAKIKKVQREKTIKGYHQESDQKKQEKAKSDAAKKLEEAKKAKKAAEKTAEKKGKKAAAKKAEQESTGKVTEKLRMKKEKAAKKKAVAAKREAKAAKELKIKAAQDAKATKEAAETTAAEKAADKKERDQLETEKALKALKAATQTAQGAAHDVNKIIASTRSSKQRHAAQEKKQKGAKRADEVTEKTKESSEEKIQKTRAQSASVTGSGDVATPSCGDLAVDDAIKLADCGAMAAAATEAAAAP